MTTSLGPTFQRFSAGAITSRRQTSSLLRHSVLGAVLLLPLFAGQAHSHEYWLAPSNYAANSKNTIEFGAAVGTGFRGEEKAFSATRCLRFIARGERMLDFILMAREGDPVWQRFQPTDEGGLMVGYESNFTPIELPAAQFDAYLAEEGLTGPLEIRKQTRATAPGRERYRRCAKTWVSGKDERRALKPLDLPLEIVPLSAPGSGHSLRVRVDYKGKPLRDALVKAWRTPLSATFDPTKPAQRDSVPVASQGRTDRKGEFTVRVEEPGEWLLSVVHMTASRDSAVADWESTWASLTFARFGEKRETAGEMRAENPRSQAH